MRPPPRSTPRLLACGLAAAGVVVLLAALVPADRPEQAASHDPSPPDRTRALAVLRSWDSARAAAWRHGDVRALRRLYVAGSPAGRGDVALLRAYADRGLRVAGMRMQVASVDVEAITGDRIALRVTDRLVGATVTRRDRGLRLLQDRWSRRRIVMVRMSDGWRVATVTPG